MTPRISVILVVLNNRVYIGQAINNFLSQQCAKAELVVVDGASTDGTREEIARMAEGQPSIRWLSEKDSGQSDAMNKGVRMARGEYISFLNVDDYYADGALNEVCALLSQPDAPAFLVGNCKVWDADGKLVYVNRPRKLRPWHILSGRHLPVNPSAYFYRRSLHDVVGPYNEANHMNMDLEFIARASLQTSMTYIDRDWGNFRMLPGTKTLGDIEAGKLEERKHALFRSVTSEAGTFVWAMTALQRFKTRWESFIRRFSYYPKAVLWKLGFR
jgi:glycosyltransferase involved in cell wall biosynthesis